MGKGTNGNAAGADDDVLRSPLAKRKKLAAERTGYSRLKVAVTADDLVQHDSGMEDAVAKRVSIPKVVEMEEDGDGDDEEEDEDEDFLACELEEEWG